ncbi:YdjY domain-containing protein [Fundidesulfovibrio terrae]|uniref:YdjY domain-containing protein n=1 Tax=Fundidesulfovibrio terrae TaxID=2922866 RepID=UPI001FB03C4B|nr:YdjY domain-containing protein [Fundidesulfovibrio terrae]
MKFSASGRARLVSHQTDRPLGLDARPPRSSRRLGRAAPFLCALALLAALGCALAPEASCADLPRGLNTKMPLNVDLAAGSVSFLAEVNREAVGGVLQHFAVDKDGDYADKALLRAFITPRQLHDALALLGFRAGNNMSMDNWNTQHVEGDALSVSVFFEATGKTADIAELLKDPGGRGLDMRFGGNLKTAAGPDASGCLVCLFSCPMGIVSNHDALFKETGWLGPVQYRAAGVPENGGWAVVTIRRK